MHIIHHDGLGLQVPLRDRGWSTLGQSAVPLLDDEHEAGLADAVADDYDAASAVAAGGLAIACTTTAAALLRG